MTDEKENETTSAIESTEAERPRRVRRTRQVDNEEAPADAALAPEAEPAVPAAEGAASAPREPRAPRAPRAPRPASDGSPRAPRPASSGSPRAPRPASSAYPDHRGTERSGARRDAPRPASSAYPDHRGTEHSGARRDAPRPRHNAVDGARSGPSASPAALSVLAVNRSNKRSVYRQDVIAAPPVIQVAEPKRSADQLMLVWHPAPKLTAPVKKHEKPLTAKEAMKAKLAKHDGAVKEGAAAALAPAPKTALDAAWLEVGAHGALDAAQAAGNAGEALVQGWLDGGNVAAITMLASLELAPSVARKAARRALNVLKSRGVAVAAPVATVVKSVLPEVSSDCIASFIPPDGNGTTFFSFCQRLPGGRFRVADIMVREHVGVVHATLGQLAGKHIRRWKVRVEESMGVPPIEVPLDWARHAVAEGRKLNSVSKQILPLGFDGCMALAAPAPAVVPPHPIAAFEQEPTKAELAAALADSDLLHAEPEFRTWVVERSALQELVAKVAERLSTADSEDRAIVDTVLLEEVAAATDRYFTAERRDAIAVRLRDAAISIRVRRGEVVARRVLVVAEAVRRAGLVTDAPRENPFLRAFFQKGMAMMARENQGRFPGSTSSASA